MFYVDVKLATADAHVRSFIHSFSPPDKRRYCVFGFREQHLKHKVSQQRVMANEKHHLALYAIHSSPGLTFGKWTVIKNLRSRPVLKWGKLLHFTPWHIIKLIFLTFSPALQTSWSCGFHILMLNEMVKRWRGRDRSYVSKENCFHETWASFATACLRVNSFPSSSHF